MATEKKQSFLGGAAVLAFGIVAVKIIGAVFKIPLRNILGEGGSADFSNAYNIYATLLTVSTAGLPVALSKLVSESYALGRTRQAHRTFRVSLSVFLVLGVASFALMWWGSALLAVFLNNPRAAYGIRALAPAVVCVGCLSAFRGYAQGRQYMTPTAVSQIIEALCKLMLGLAGLFNLGGVLFLCVLALGGLGVVAGDDDVITVVLALLDSHTADLDALIALSIHRDFHVAPTHITDVSSRGRGRNCRHRHAQGQDGRCRPLHIFP